MAARGRGVSGEPAERGGRAGMGRGSGWARSPATIHHNCLSRGRPAPSLPGMTLPWLTFDPSGPSTQKEGEKNYQKDYHSRQVIQLAGCVCVCVFYLCCVRTTYYVILTSALLDLFHNSSSSNFGHNARVRSAILMKVWHHSGQKGSTKVLSQ